MAVTLRRSSPTRGLRRALTNWLRAQPFVSSLLNNFPTWSLGKPNDQMDFLGLVFPSDGRRHRCLLQICGGAQKGQKDCTGDLRDNGSNDSIYGRLFAGDPINTRSDVIGCTSHTVARHTLPAPRCVLTAFASCSLSYRSHPVTSIQRPSRALLRAGVLQSDPR